MVVSTLTSRITDKRITSHRGGKKKKRNARRRAGWSALFCITLSLSLSLSLSVRMFPRHCCWKPVGARWYGTLGTERHGNLGRANFRRVSRKLRQPYVGQKTIRNCDAPRKGEPSFCQYVRESFEYFCNDFRVKTTREQTWFLFCEKGTDVTTRRKRTIVITSHG